MDEMKTNVVRDATGRFLPGRSGNPALGEASLRLTPTAVSSKPREAGKKPGTRNHATLLREALNEGEDRAAAHLVIDKALEGNLVAARFIVDRLMPRPRGREIEIELPDGAGAGDIVAGYDATVQAMMDGEITPDEALTVTRVLDGRLRALKAASREEGKLSPAHRKQPSPFGRGQGEGIGRGIAGADLGSSRRPHPNPLPEGEGTALGGGVSLSHEGRGRFLGDHLLHSTCISTLPALASGGVRGTVPSRPVAGGAAFS